MISTSQIAKQKFDSSGKKETHYKAILKALDKITKGCSKAIAKQSGLNYHQVSRRLPELERMEKVEVIEMTKTPYYKTPVNIYQKVY